MYALAIGMDADPKRLRPLKWNSLRAERMSYDSLKPYCNVAFRRIDESFDPDNSLEQECLTVAVKHWNSYTKQKLNLFAEIEGKVTRLVVCRGDAKPMTVLVRLNGDRWESCGYCTDDATKELETCDTPALLPPKDVSQELLSLIVYPGVSEAPPVTAIPSDNRIVEDSFKSELQNMLSLSGPLLNAMKKLTLSLDQKKPHPRGPTRPIPEKPTIRPKKPDKNDTRVY